MICLLNKNARYPALPALYQSTCYSKQFAVLLFVLFLPDASITSTSSKGESQPMKLSVLYMLCSNHLSEFAQLVRSKVSTLPRLLCDLHKNLFLYNFFFTTIQRINHVEDWKQE